MTNVEEIAIDNVFNLFDLKPADRCDRCGESSQAFVVAHKSIDDKDYVILLCGHHFAQNEPALLAGGFYIQDERHLINKTVQSTPNV